MPRDERSRVLRHAYETRGVAEHYRGDRWTAARHARRTDRKERAIVASFLASAGRVASVLDVPCGAGRLHGLLAPPRAAERRLVVAADVAVSMLAQARAAPGAVERGLRFVQASATHLPLASHSVDVVVCMRLLHHFAEPAERTRVLKECARVTRGHVIASYFDGASLQALRRRITRRRSGRHAQSRASFAAEARAAGLRVIARRHVFRGVSEQVLALLRLDA